MSSAPRQRNGWGSTAIFPGERIWVGGQWFYLAGILNPALLASEIDSSVPVGFDGHPTTIYVRSETSRVAAVQSVLAATANPEAPNEVDVSQPSAASPLAAPRKTRSTAFFSVSAPCRCSSARSASATSC